MEIRYDPASETAEALVEGKPFPTFTGYWFAWYGFHPKTKVWGESDETRSAPTGDPAVTIVGHEGGWGDLTGVGPGGEIADAGSIGAGTIHEVGSSTVSPAGGSHTSTSGRATRSCRAGHRPHPEHRGVRGLFP